MSNKLSYSSIGKTVDGTTFCSGVETLAENIIEDSEDDSVIVFPSATGWASMRSEAYRMTTDNVEMQVPLPIYKIKNVFLKFDNIYIGWGTGGSAAWHANLNNFTDDKGNTIQEVNVTDFIIQDVIWNSLSLADSKNPEYPEYIEGIYKDNTFAWSQGEDTIKISSEIYKIGIGGIPMIIPTADETPCYIRFLRSVLFQIGADYKNSMGQTLREAVGNSYIVSISNVDPRKWRFRIEYVPMTSKTKLRARKNATTKEDYIQPFNQRAEINAASAFGKNMYLTAQKTGCKEITLIKDYTSLDDIPPIGALVRHHGKKYRLVANHYDITNTVYIKVTHTLSENWSEKSKHVSVDQKYRNWTIPQDMLWRNLYWEDYLRVGTSRKRSDYANGSIALEYIMKVLSVDTSADRTIDTLSWYTYKDTLVEWEDAATVYELRGVSIPCSTYGIANSMIVSASFKDNLSAGLRGAVWNETESEYYCEETFYCKSDGTLDVVNVILGAGCGTSTSIDNLDANQSLTVSMLELVQDIFYPAILQLALSETGYVLGNAVRNPVFDQKFYVYKDAGEAIKFTYQIHLIGEDDCVFGNKFAEHNPLVKDWKDVNRTIKVWALNHYVREGADILETVGEDTCYDQTEDDTYYTIEKLSQNKYEESYYGEVYTLTLTETLTSKLSGCKAWAITDKDNNLYVACNNVSVSTLYFQLHHKR